MGRIRTHNCWLIPTFRYVHLSRDKLVPLAYTDVRSNRTCLRYALAAVGVAALIAPTVIRMAHAYAPDASMKMGEAFAHESVELRRQRRAHKLPLRRPISGLPGFGLVAGIIYALIAIVMMVMSTAFAYMPRGVSVQLLKPEAVPHSSDPWAEPLIVLAKTRGPGKIPNLFVNSKLVPWEDFDHVLKQELGRRREWVVYVGGDDDVQWQDVVNLIDVARRDRATAYLITGPQSH